MTVGYSMQSHIKKKMTCNLLFNFFLSICILENYFFQELLIKRNVSSFHLSLKRRETLASPQAQM